MGQYQQWLHYQEIDRHLRATLDALEQELAQLESQCRGSQQPAMSLDNPIISALCAYMAINLNGHAPPQDVFEITNSSPSGQANSVDTISAALAHSGQLPDFGSQEGQPSQQYEIQSSLSIDHPEIELFPDDMFAFFEEPAQTDPQIELPWWLRKITVTNGEEETSKPIDQESIRTNRLVQRWVERWGHQSQFPPDSESEGHDE